jgi:cytochrome c oxidase subunit I+III
MHILGLLGMPRRIYTYHSGLGWDFLNLLATIGAFTLAVGILGTIVNVVWSRSRGEIAGDDPWGANTLEWSTSSPPPEFNFASLPVVRSADPNWDREDRLEDAARVERGELTLSDGHETIGSSWLDGDIEEIHESPSESPWPLILAACLTLLFVTMLSGHWWTAMLAAGACLLAWGGWHLKEPGA